MRVQVGKSDSDVVAVVRRANVIVRVSYYGPVPADSARAQVLGAARQAIDAIELT